MVRPTVKGRMPYKRAQVVAYVRELIVSGRAAPGARLPTHKELEALFDAESPTIRAAMSVLSADGFIETRHRSGTFVAASPPHLHRYGLVFWNAPDGAAPLRFSWSRYFDALTCAAAELNDIPGLSVLQYHAVDWHTDTPDRIRLIADIEAQRLSGVIFANAPFYFKGSPILDLPGIPRMALESGPTHPNVRDISFDYAGWIERALAWVAGRGCRKVAFLVLSQLPRDLILRFKAGVEAKGMTTRSRWIQSAARHDKRSVHALVELLMADSDRPDALLISDDNLVEAALNGLTAAGVAVPEHDAPRQPGDIVVVGHANFPLPPARPQTVRLLGFDMRSALQTCVAAIDAWRKGRPPARMTQLPAQWEDDVTGPPASQAELDEMVSCLQT